MKITTEKEKEYMKEWYKKNREHHISKVRNRQIANNYEAEKTEKQRKLRYIKRRTRLLYPLGRKKCEFCGFKATEHHHFTIPLKVHEFNFVCHDCHMELDEKMGNHSNINSGGLI